MRGGMFPIGSEKSRGPVAMTSAKIKDFFLLWMITDAFLLGRDPRQQERFWRRLALHVCWLAASKHSKAVLTAQIGGAWLDHLDCRFRG